uniref:ATP synthase subunit a n=1 Tax=Cyanidiococcus yangmingshanensis TaxID=2690220 RepID=A0A7H0WBE4_9RHOD|nr:ATP synthase F0 subunit 6 [Cyanidiococcus yangmingshanensis]UNJ18945.1 ATP synthase F0 subunit 6 [Cyanidioschyzonaceae sp. 2 FvB-2021]
MIIINLNNNFMASPLEQFELVTLIPLNIFDYNVSITNATLFLFINLFTLLFITFFSIKSNFLVPTRWQLIIEIIYEFVIVIILDNLGKKGERYFPLIFTIFIILLVCNIIGLIPYSFTVTSHIFFTFGLAFAVFVGINIIGIKEHGFHFFAIFLPKGAPLTILPLLVVIEFISYIVKVFTLAIRLFANMTSGHTLLKIIAGFSWTLLTLGGFLSLLHLFPLLILFVLIGLELGIAFLQAYVFALLVCIYLNDVIEFH